MTITPDPIVGPRDRLEYVDQLRALAALYVAVYHAMLTVWPAGGARPPWYFRWADYGHFGVTAFIVVSGFSLALRPAMRGAASVGSYWGFMVKRGLRILPPYWVALAGSIVLLMLAPGGVARGNSGGASGEWTGKSAIPLRSVVAFLTLTHDFVRVPSPNSPLWSIPVEWHLYFLFPVLLYAAHRFGLVRVVIGSVLVATALHYVVVHTSLVGTTPHFIALFCFGIAAAHAVAAARVGGLSPPSRRLRGWVLVAASFATFALLAHAEVLADFVAGAIFAVALYELGRGGQTIEPRRPTSLLTRIGLISFSLYLVHSPVEKIVWHFAVQPLGASSAVKFTLLAGIGVPAAVFAAWLLYVLIERRSMAWSRHVPSS
jgi:peptidoglycan/LPS O-acetylase OafA/YrhL